MTSGGGAIGGGAAGGMVAGGSPRGVALAAISTGAASSCAVLTDGTVRCWGANGAGQLGNGSTGDSLRPVVVTGLSSIDQVSVGREHVCAKTTSGLAYCWGRNANGQLGNDSVVDSRVPVQVMGLTNVASIHAGVFSTCARLTTMGVACWGRGGDLGDGTTTASRVPRTIPNLVATQLSMSSGYLTSDLHVCGVRPDRSVFCWGDNSEGQLGNGNQDSSRVPVTVIGITDAIAVGAGPTHACALRLSGVSCWGSGQQVGDGANLRRVTPVSVPLMGHTIPSVALALTVGEDHTLVRTTAGAVLCWGRGTSGQCGTRQPFTPGGPNHLTPVVAGVTAATFLAAGGGHSCVYSTMNDQTSCFGSNEFGELGFDTTPALRTASPALVEW